MSTNESKSNLSLLAVALGVVSLLAHYQFGWVAFVVTVSGTVVGGGPFLFPDPRVSERSLVGKAQAVLAVVLLSAAMGLAVGGWVR